MRMILIRFIFSIPMGIASATPQIKQNRLEIPTTKGCWVLPCNCQLLKLLLENQAIRASDLHFESPAQCHIFIKELFLLALEDEVQTRKPSSLAKFARDMVAHNQSSQS